MGLDTFSCLGSAARQCFDSFLLQMHCLHLRLTHLLDGNYSDYCCCGRAKHQSEYEAGSNFLATIGTNAGPHVDVFTPYFDIVSIVFLVRVTKLSNPALVAGVGSGRASSNAQNDFSNMLRTSSYVLHNVAHATSKFSPFGLRPAIKLYASESSTNDWRK